MVVGGLVGYCWVIIKELWGSCYESGCYDGCYGYSGMIINGLELLRERGFHRNLLLRICCYK